MSEAVIGENFSVGVVERHRETIGRERHGGVARNVCIKASAHRTQRVYLLRDPELEGPKNPIGRA